MRIGIFSDTHANLEALSAVLKALKEESPDAYVCIGDTVGYGANPNECCDLVREITKFTILGNHDAAVAGRMDYSYYYEAARQALDWHAAILSDENMSWLRNLKYISHIDYVAFSHGSPVNLEEFEYIFALDQARELCDSFDTLAPITFIGHSHLLKIFSLKKISGNGKTAEFEVEEHFEGPFQLDPERKYIISVGSVGQPRDYDNRACCVLFDTETRKFDYKRVEYDIESAAQKIFDSDLALNFGKRLFLGV
jgi:diadenosine tetraphosphatase ApaH/serine/threonine PP2A family protein phosphatase